MKKKNFLKKLSDQWSVLKKSRKIITVSIIIFLMLVGGVLVAKDTSLKTMKDKVSYGIGLDIGSNLKEQEIDIDLKLLLKGIKDALKEKEKLMTDEELKETMMAFQKKMMEKQSVKMGKLSSKNKEEGEKFLAENKKKKDVIIAKSGLQYKVITKGKGKNPAADDTVEVHYKGTLIDGTVFDSSYERGKPVTFPVGGVIKGWTEALKLMKVGAKWELYIPSDLAYGERGAGRDIGPNSTLIFEVELLSIKKAEK